MLLSTSAEPLHDSVYNGPYKFPFIPPSDSFNLCYYTSQVTAPFQPVLFASVRTEIKTPLWVLAHVGMLE